MAWEGSINCEPESMRLGIIDRNGVGPAPSPGDGIVVRLPKIVAVDLLVDRLTIPEQRAAGR